EGGTAVTTKRYADEVANGGAGYAMHESYLRFLEEPNTEITFVTRDKTQSWRRTATRSTIAPPHLESDRRAEQGTDVSFRIGGGTLHSSVFNKGQRRFLVVRALTQWLGIPIQGKEVINEELRKEIRPPVPSTSSVKEPEWMEQNEKILRQLTPE